MKVFLASDHAGFDLKNKIKIFLSTQNYQIEDMGDFQKQENDDYPQFIALAAEKVSQNPNHRAIVFGKSGTGEEIVANKFKNVRAVLGFNAENVRLSRQDNDTNVLSLGSQFVNPEDAIELVKIFLETPFSNAKRHQRRVDEITDIEKS